MGQDTQHLFVGQEETPLALYFIYAAIIIVLIAVVGFGVLWGEYGADILLGIFLLVFFGSVYMGIGLFIGGTYLFFYILEETGAIDDNPIENFIFNVLYEWYLTLSNLDIIRNELIYTEYLVVLLLGLEEFDVNNRSVQRLFFCLSAPFIWFFILILKPFLSILMPGVLLTYYYDPAMY